MRIQHGQWSIAGASKMGFLHSDSRKNCQDAFVFGGNEGYLFGAVFDGCGESAHSEVGALLAAEYVGATLPVIAPLCHKDVPPMLFRYLVSFVRRSISQFEDVGVWTREYQAKFIDDYWLFTVMGFLMGPEQISFFWAGDGVYQRNDELTIITSPEIELPHPQGVGIPYTLSVCRRGRFNYPICKRYALTNVS
jgi:hypothetical protein